jgi:uncharacterized SAM-binding protein YcdF (DUF218 family)
MSPPRLLFFGAGVILLALLLVLGRILQDFPYIPESLIFRHQPKPADAIVFLAGGPAYERIDYAFELAEARLAPVFFTPGGEDVARIKLIRAKAKRDTAIFTFVEGEINKRNSTFGEALSTKSAVKKNGWKTILLVTSPEHSRRAFWIFRRVLPKKISLISCPVPVEKSTFVPDHLTPGTKPWKRFRDEQKKLLWYYICYGWRFYSSW